VVDRYYLALTSTNHKPQNKESLKAGLESFIYNGYGNSKVTRSWMIYFLHHEPEEIVKVDKHQELTSAIIDFYTKGLFGGVNINISQYDMQKFVEASEKLVHFFEVNADYLTMVYQQERLPHYLWEAIRKFTTDPNKITPAYFCSEITMSNALPKYLINEGILKKYKTAYITEERNYQRELDDKKAEEKYFENCDPQDVDDDN
jgi:hypothetical protein